MMLADPNAIADDNPALPKKPPAVTTPAPLPVAPQQRETPQAPVAPASTPLPSGNDAVNTSALPVTPPPTATNAPAPSPTNTALRAAAAANPATAGLPVQTSGALANIGSRPVATENNWQGADAAGASWDKANEARSLAAQQYDDTHGYNAAETQEELNLRRGMVKGPNGSWEAPGSAGALAVTNPNPTTATLGPNGSPLPVTGQASGIGPFGGGAPDPMTPNLRVLPPSITGLPSTPSPQDRSGDTPLETLRPEFRTGYAPPVAATLPLTPSPSAPSENGGALPVSSAQNPNTVNPAGIDRLALAKSNFDNFASASDPYFQKSLRDANSSAAGAGQLGSGQLRTSLGDLAYNRDLQLNAAKTGYLNDATNNSIEDSYRNYGIGQQDQSTAFNQSVIQTQVEEALRSGDFSRAMQLLGAGEAGNPSSTAQQLSTNYGQQASDAGNAAAGLVKNSTANGGGSDLPGWLKDLLRWQQSTGQAPQVDTPRALPVGQALG